MYDLVIKNARKLNGMTFDIGITKGKICEIAPLITKKSWSENQLDPSAIFVGWLDRRSCSLF